MSCLCAVSRVLTFKFLGSRCMTMDGGGLLRCPLAHEHFLVVDPKVGGLDSHGEAATTWNVRDAASLSYCRDELQFRSKPPENQMLINQLLLCMHGRGGWPS